jgi:hypothetical protein
LIGTARQLDSLFNVIVEGIEVMLDVVVEEAVVVELLAGTVVVNVVAVEL